VIDIDKSVWPQPLLQFLACHHFAGPLQQDGQNLKWLASKSQLHATFAQLSRWKVNFKGCKPD
jgi:hypothetical protein